MVFDARIHPAGLTDQDLSTLRSFGVEGALAVADATPHGTADDLLAHFEELVSVQLPRMEKAGLRAYAALGVHPAALPRRGFEHVLESLPGFCRGGKVLAVGLVGLFEGGEAEEEALLAQLALAARLRLKVMVASPHRQREPVTRRTLALLREADIEPADVLVDGATLQTVRVVRECGHWAGLTLHPDHLAMEKAVALVNTLGPEGLVLESAAGDGASELLALPRAVHRLTKAGLSRGVVARACGDNAARFLGLERPAAP
jgi:predicted metal-dependent TIM-barrel fold hydrolase